MKYEEWCRVRLTEPKVLNYLKKVLKKQNEKPQEDRIALVKRNTLLRSVAVALAFLSVWMMFLFSNGMIYASAAEQSESTLPMVRVEEKTVHRGQTFEIRIYLDQNPGLISLMLDLEYDKTAMELVGVTRGDALNTHTFTTTNTDTDEGFLISPFRIGLS